MRELEQLGARDLLPYGYAILLKMFISTN